VFEIDTDFLQAYDACNERKFLRILADSVSNIKKDQYGLKWGQ
jgi:hypothetical protein